jgi:hypothetical protein
MPKETYTVKEERRIAISHGRATLQNANPPVCCPHCGYKLEILTFTGGILIEELNNPSPADPQRRRSFVFIPAKVNVEKAYSKTAKIAITFRAAKLDEYQP